MWVITLILHNVFKFRELKKENLLNLPTDFVSSSIASCSNLISFTRPILRSFSSSVFLLSTMASLQAPSAAAQGPPIQVPSAMACPSFTCCCSRSSRPSPVHHGLPPAAAQVGLLVAGDGAQHTRGGGDRCCVGAFFVPMELQWSVAGTALKRRRRCNGVSS